MKLEANISIYEYSNVYIKMFDKAYYINGFFEKVTLKVLLKVTPNLVLLF
jgi:hypothetical protein